MQFKMMFLVDTKHQGIVYDDNLKKSQGGKMAKKRVTRKKLLKEPDEFITFSSKLFRFISENRKSLQWGGIICVLIILSISLYNYISIQKEKNALQMLGSAMAIGTVSGDSPKSDSMTKQQFENLIDQFPRTDAGKIGKLLYANICFKEGDYDRALIFYQQALIDFDPEPSFKNIILSGLGHSYREKKDTASAIKYFEAIASGSDDLLKDEALFQLGHLYENDGDSTKSMEAFKKIVSDFSDSLYGSIVKEKIAGSSQ